MRIIGVPSYRHIDGRRFPRELVPVSAGVFAASVALRPALTGVGPLLPRLQRDLGVSHSVAGLLPGLLLLFMGLSSLAAPGCVRRWGWRRTTTSALLLTTTAALLRAVAPPTVAVILLTIPIGIGAGIAGTTLPAAVTDLYPERRATGAGVHALGINIGAAGAAALAVPLAVRAEGWRGALAIFAVAGFALTLLWIASVRGEPDHARPPRVSLPIRNRRAWLLTALFALQGLCYYGLGAWLPNAYVERGWGAGEAGALVAVITAAAVPASFLAPRLSERLGSRRPPLAVSAAGLLVGSVGVAEWTAAAWPSVVLIGISLGGLFSLCLLLAIDLGRPAGAVAGFAGMMLGFGYMISAAAPILLGAARDQAGSFSAALWLVVAIAGSLLVLVLRESAGFAPSEKRRAAG
jgi:CP family cyanate transporter-like MFS transporter